jgi:hypothetical protein
LNWNENPLGAMKVAIAKIIAGGIIHSLITLIHLTRMKIHNQIVKKREMKKACCDFDPETLKDLL